MAGVAATRSRSTTSSTERPERPHDGTSFLDELADLRPEFDRLLHFEPIDAMAGTRIICEQDEARELFVRLSGRARAIFPNGSGQADVVARFLPGTVI
ncbi:hypothetical protein AB0T83_15280 [Fluviibacterium sp. DFM31]|uniref:Cyclic nucleotide-binding domain-containing protein n=1 Tax=Meridianimarinicoccus marinus TaxID=3231483 RepID=A0ABV3LAT2_9RHOB